MKYAFQTRSHLYLIMDLLTGGDMRYQLCNRPKFKEKETQFIVACIVLALEYIHSQGYIHRDIKPENLVFDEKGYIHVTDFGICKKYRANNQEDTSGTPGYMAPEVMCRQNHTKSVDFFAVGVIAYECMFQKRPFLGKTRREIREVMCKSEIIIKNSKIPYGWSYEAADFINKCIRRKKQERLGHRGIKDVKNHPWLQDFDWKALYNKTLTAPFIPPSKENYDNRATSYAFKDEYSLKSLEEAKGMMDDSIQKAEDVQEFFKDYYYDYREKGIDSQGPLYSTVPRELKMPATKPQTN